MTGRAALDSYIESLQILARTDSGDRTDAEQEADARHRALFIDGHAHELAEQQRAALPGVMERWFPLHQDAITEVIDLIDPKARRASTEGDTP